MATQEGFGYFRVIGIKLEHRPSHCTYTVFVWVVQEQYSRSA